MFIKYNIFAIIIITIIIVLTLNFFYKENINNDTQIKAILRGSSRFTLASLQDKSPLIALLHANYGTGYFWALRDAFTDKEITKSTGLDIVEYQKKITTIQDNITKNIIKLCPNFGTELDLSLAKIAGEY